MTTSAPPPGDLQGRSPAAPPGGARSEVLARIRRALGPESRSAVDGPAVAPRSGAALRSGSAPLAGGALVERLVDRLVDYDARVRQVDRAGVEDAVSAALGERRRVVIPPGLDRTWLGRRQEVTVDDGALTATGLDSFDAVVTACRLAIAETGTIVCDAGPGQGRRALTLVPDHHVCVVMRSQVVPAVADAVAALDPTRPLTWISGPSATSDIELVRVQGVHGPRRLDVVIVGDAEG